MTLHRITTVGDVESYLHTALQLEHATIPPYLGALYSIRPDTNPESAEILRSVVIEEMLHLLLIANLINAIGATPSFSHDGFVPSYPTHLPDGETDFEVSIRPFSPEAIETFLQIERPGDPDKEISFIDRRRSERALLPAFHHEDEGELHFFSIGEFYAELDRGLHAVYDDLEARDEMLFDGDPARQVTTDFEYHGGGRVIPVTDLASADAAIRLICDQGEGLGGTLFDEDGALSHYFRLEQIKVGRRYVDGDEPGRPTGDPITVEWDAVYPITMNARLDDFVHAPDLHASAKEFSDSYRGFLEMLTAAHNGAPESLDAAVGEMFRLRRLIRHLVEQPVPDRDAHCSPVFHA